MPESADLDQLAEIDRDECLRLLSRGHLGRVIYTDAAMPTALPVTFNLDHGEIVFRAGGGSRLALATREAVVAFEADEIDPVSLRGWCVLGVGHTYEVTDPDRRAGLLQPLPTPWAPAGPTVTIAIRLQRITGRRLCPDTDALL